MRTRLLSFMMAFLCLPLITFAPHADARAGRGFSMGSRGSHTWSAPPRTSLTPQWSRPRAMDRSVTPPPRSTPNPSSPGMSSSPYGNRFGSSAARPHFAARHPFLTGLMGGFAGAGLFGLLSGHGFFHGFSSGGGSFFGFLIQVLIVAVIINFLIRLWRKPTMSGAHGQTNESSFNNNNPFTSTQPNASVSATLSQDDYLAFQNLLTSVQTSWSHQDISSLQRLVSPEMVSYFNEQLSELTSRGARNIISDIRFLRGDLSEAWREGNLTYATVALQYSLIDVTTNSMGHVIDGSRTDTQTVTELWTFMRADGRGNWIVSAIQQTE